MRNIVRLLLFLIFTTACNVVIAQNATLSGYIKDANNGETLIGATVYADGTNTGTHTNVYGFYSLSLPKGKYIFRFYYIGYKTVDTTIILLSNTILNLNLSHNAENIKEVVISADRRKDENVKSTDMGKVELSVEKLKTLPVVFGEPDVLKMIQLLPGVQSGGEGSTGFYVRGGGPDQNLILLDEATVYNASHLFGFFSTFNSDAIKGLTLYKEGMPAQYGGRISSVVDITMKDGNDKEVHGSGGIGLIASRLMLEGPIKKNKCSFLVSARRTYLDVLLKPVINQNAQFKGSGYYFYDLNGKLNYTFSNKDRLFLSGYYGKDVFTYANGTTSFKIPWGNATATLRWNHVFSPKLFLNSSLIYNDYSFNIDAAFSIAEFVYYSAVKTWNNKWDFDWYAGPRHSVKFGLQAQYHRFYPGTFSGSVGNLHFQDSLINVRRAFETGIYAEDKWTISEKIEANIGGRLNMFNQVGPFEKVQYNADGSIKDTLRYKNNQNIATYFGADPRLLMRFTLSPTSSIKVAYTYIHQYLNLVSNSGTTLPTDIWVPATNIIKPQTGSQYSAGYFRNFADNMFETYIEVYYKNLQNQIEYSQVLQQKPGQDLEDIFIFGSGQSYGAEVFINKQYGRLTGWIGYTLSSTTRHFNNIVVDAQGNIGPLTYPARYDRRNNVSLIASYKLNKHWNVGGVFVYETGFHYTPVIGRAVVSGNFVPIYGEINSAKMPDYSRLDISFRYEGQRHKRFQSSWSFDVYNVYNRQNPYFIYYNTIGDPAHGITSSVATAVTIFPILPSITWNFKF